MQVRDIITETAKMLNLNDVISELQTPIAQQSDTLRTLLKCAETAVCEIVEEHRPLKYRETLRAKEGMIPYSAFTKPVHRIYSVKDELGYNIRYTTLDDGLKINAESATVTYSHYFKDIYLDTDIDICEVPIRVVCYGVIGYYLTFSLRYEEGAMYLKKFVNSLKNVLRSVRGAVLPKVFKG